MLYSKKEVNTVPLIKSEKDTQRDIETYNNLRQKFIDNGYKETAYIMNGFSSNSKAVLYVFPIAIMYLMTSVYFKGAFFEGSFINFIIVILLLMISTPIHEYLHGLGWAIFCKDKFKSISINLSFGFRDDYCHCREELSSMQYIFGTILPFIVLSIVPLFISIFIPSNTLFLFAFSSLFSCSADIYNIIKALKHRQGTVLDYPTDTGFVIFEK